MDACYELVAFTQRALDHGRLAAGLFIDITKAFDCVDKDLFLKKLKTNGLTGPALSLFESYMSDRQQLVKIGEVLSRSEVIESGVPQGSVLGPIGFLIYINDLGKINLHGRIIFFADDACLLYDSDKLDDLYMYMKQDIEILMKWFSNNLLLLNLKKTEYVIFHKRSIIVEKRDLYVNNILITNTNI